MPVEVRVGPRGRPRKRRGVMRGLHVMMPTDLHDRMRRYVDEPRARVHTLRDLVCAAVEEFLDDEARVLSRLRGDARVPPSETGAAGGGAC